MLNYQRVYIYISGWWFQPTPLKNMSQMGWFFPTEWKFIKFRGSSHHEPAVINADLEHHFLIFRGSTRSEWSHLLLAKSKRIFLKKKHLHRPKPLLVFDFSSWNPNFRLFTTKSPWTSVHQRKSPISMFGPKKISNNHQVLLLTSSFSGYHHWNPHITISDGKNLITIEIPMKAH